MTDEILIAKLDQSEDPWVERKESFDERDGRRTIVGFANLLPQGAEPAVLYLGASNKPQHPGLRDADGIQKKVHAQANQNSYPPITVSYGSNFFDRFERLGRNSRSKYTAPFL
jgi:hypothetical protein